MGPNYLLSPPPTTVPINRHLQNRGPRETDLDGPAAMVTRGASSPPPASQAQAQTPADCVSYEGMANNASQGVPPNRSHDSFTCWEIPLPTQVPGKIKTGPERCEKADSETVKFPVNTVFSTLATP